VVAKSSSARERGARDGVWRTWSIVDVLSALSR
jgi:hypothetical protein